MASHLRAAVLAVILASVLAAIAAACGSSSTSLAGPTSLKCPVTVTNSMSAAPASGAAGTLAVATTRDCTWAASTSTAWITLTSGSSGQGDGTVQYRVAANTDHASRRGTLAVNDQQITIAQDAAACQYTLDAINSTVPAGGGSVAVKIGTDGACAWTAVSNANWISVTAGSGGSGAGSVTLGVAPNSGGSRSGTVTIAGQTFTVTQQDAAPSCSASLDTTTQNFAASGGTGAVALTLATGCRWTATSSAEWVTITSSASGTGSAQVAFSVGANPTTSIRRATIAIAGQTFTVTQDATGCSYTIAPTSQTADPNGGSVSVSVTTLPTCSWTTTPNDSWITVASEGRGTGSGSVGLSVAANTGGPRTGTATIAGQTFTIAQGAASCSYSITPSSETVAATGGTGSVGVTAGGSCAWTASSNVSWITVTSGASGTGNGTVTFTVTANSGGARSGTLTVAGQSFTVNQAAPSCSYSINPGAQTFGPTAGTGSIAVTAGSSCAWTATTNDNWITITSGASGTGTGSVAFSVAANTGGARSGTIAVAGQTFTVTQSAGTCTFAIAPTTKSFSAAGGSDNVSVTTTAGCSWTVTSGAAWITITSGASGSGNGSVGYTVAANTGPARSGTLTISGQTFTVNQDAAPCSYSIAPTNQSLTAAGGTGTVGVTSGAGCSWTATSNVTWITITSGASASGNGTVGYTVAANTGAARSGTLTIAGQTFTVNQGASCAYSIAPPSQSLTAAGGTGSVAVTSDAGCSWTATSNATWITITSGASGSGNGSVGYTAAANTGAARSGTVTIAGQTFTLNQAAAPCSYSISPTSQSVTAAGGTGTVGVTSTAGCSWTATSNTAWITVTSGASGSGNGNAGYTVAANTGAARSGTVTIAGQTFTVNQAAAPCSYSISPTSQSFTAAGGTGTVGVTSSAGCSWTAVSNAAWITITSGASGSGNGSVGYSVAANSSGSDRTETLTIAGQTFTVTQSR